MNLNRSIKIVPLLNPPILIINEIKYSVEEIFKIPVIVEKNIIIPNDYKNISRNQYSATNLIYYLKTNINDDFLKIVGIISEDIYEEGYNFLFGLAEFNGKYAVVSLYRLYDENFEIYKVRSIKEVIHELGHTFGLGHCENYRCVMNFSISTYNVDQKDKKFCQFCLVKLNTILKNLKLIWDFVENDKYYDKILW